MMKNNLLPKGCIRIFLLKTEILRLLFGSIGFGLLLLLARTIYTGSVVFLFLAWNLFLAFTPWLLSYSLTQKPAWIHSKWKFALAFTVWLLFVPNSFYMLTDLFHLYDSNSVPAWYDLMLIFCFAWNALLMGILSVRHMEKIMQAVWQYQSGRLFIYPVMLLNAFGIILAGTCVTTAGISSAILFTWWPIPFTYCCTRSILKMHGPWCLYFLSFSAFCTKRWEN